MAPVTIIAEDTTTVDGQIDGERVLVSPSSLTTALGWTLKPEGLCRDDVCVPVRDRDALRSGELLDVAAVASALGRQSVVDADAGLVAVALGESADDVRPWTEGITLPVLLDRRHLLTELYAISNVPTVIWIDEDDRIVRPNSVAFSTDMFAEFTGAYAGPHLHALRSWVRDGVATLSADDARA